MPERSEAGDGRVGAAARSKRSGHSLPCQPPGGVQWLFKMGMGIVCGVVALHDVLLVRSARDAERRVLLQKPRMSNTAADCM
jgi:hypothetical protein